MTTKKMGRPPKDIDWEKLDIYCEHQMSLEDTAYLLDMDSQTLERKIKKKYKLTFRQFRAKKLSSTRMKLKQKAVSMALMGDKTMLIFCLKNLVGWADQPAIIDNDEEEAYPEPE
jgi:hypothetical protein